jgi:hypothetical protein
MDVPLHANGNERTTYLESFREMFLEALQDEAIVDEFMFCWNGMATVRPHFELPIDGAPALPISNGDGIIRILPSRPFSYHEVPEEGVLDTLVNGKVIRFRIESKELLVFLMAQETVSLKQLYDRFASTYSEEQIGELVSDLAALGILALNYDGVTLSGTCVAEMQ